VRRWSAILHIDLTDSLDVLRENIIEVNIGDSDGF
jgi:hypothetical protein